MAGSISERTDVVIDSRPQILRQRREVWTIFSFAQLYKALRSPKGVLEFL